MIPTDFLDALPVGIIITDVQLQLIQMNQWIVSRLADHSTDYRGKALTEVFPEVKERRILSAFELVQENLQPVTLATGIHHYFIKIKLPPDSELPYMPQNTTITPLLNNGNLTGFITVIQDISGRMLDEMELRRANTRLATLLRVAHLLGNQLALQPLLDSVVNLLVDVFDADSAVFERPKEGSPAFCVAAKKGNVRTPSEEMRADIHIRGRLEGVLKVYANRERRRFTLEEQELLDSLASQIGLALENALLYAQQQQLAITDGLTGLANRRRLDEELAYYMQRDAYQGQPTSLVMIDIDDFKIFNDTYGHPAGDQLLKSLADALVKNLRRHDVAARYGGEEFALILPTTSREVACKIAERIRRAATKTMSATIPSKRLFSRRDKPAIDKVTISLGIATAPEDGVHPAALIQAADQALYIAKTSGKNRVVGFSSPHK